ncbi:MAG: primosomal protein N' [Lachnospiraceae bacterium]|nr:primosomal protein N' [Lachnospiraceae bacterium]
MQYAEVIVDIASDKLDKPFTYLVPEELRGQVKPGCRVKIPFRSRTIMGYVVGLAERTDLAPEIIRPIEGLVTGEETADSRLVALAAWMARTYGSTTIRALKTVLPVRKKVKSVEKRQVFLRDRQEAEAYAAFCQKRHYAAKERVLRFLLDQGEAVDEGVLKKETNVPLSVLTSLKKEGMIGIDVSEEYRRVVWNAKKYPPEELSEEQERAVETIRGEWSGTGGGRPVLLEGVTGSGKTLVYMELIADALARGQQAIVLIPEIALTYQTVLRFVARFGDRVSFLHSRLSEGEKYDQMRAARAGDISIMVGPRSALFTPFPHLGLIIIDEEHETSYHSEQMPRYYAQETAIERASLEDAHVLLGSATPSVRSMRKARLGVYLLVKMAHRYADARLPETEIVDMKAEMKKGNRSILSDRLKEEIGDRLAKREQILLFLNRRGYTGCVTCRSCGKVIKCPHCDVSLVRHRDGRLICHYCGFEMDDVDVCPDCGSREIGGLTVGTEQVEDLLKKEFPGVRVLRMDADTTRGKGGHERIVKSFAAGEADILLGTQMIVKGHDFHNVTLVGVLLADLSLNEADYRSGERTYQLLAQAVGRAGRGAKPGCAIIQTYRPDNYAVLFGARQNYTSFYEAEISFRNVLGYPPVGSMLAVLGSSEDEKLLKTGMQYLKKYVGRIDPKGTLHAIGPAPQSVGKVKDRYRMVMYLSHTDEKQLILAREYLEKYISVNPGYAHITIEFDQNL